VGTTRVFWPGEVMTTPYRLRLFKKLDESLIEEEYARLEG
jgi:hypothetical protein